MNSTLIRYAVLTAVSTKAQATDDKVSLGEQLEACRDRGTRRGWIETAGPYIVAGQSRTRYVDLSKAESDIPTLHAMLEDAKSGRFDVLAIFDYNRLRDLLDLVSTVLTGYGIQLFSATQPIEPVPPEEFKPYLASTQDIMQSMSKVISKRQADDLRIKYESGMSGRATKLGLPARIPWGYRKPVGREWDPKAIPEQIPEIIPILIQMKDMLLAGQSIRQIRNWLESEGVPSPGGKGQWYPTIIRDTLVNSFYAGVVSWGKSRIVFDARERKTKKNKHIDSDQIITAPGAHIAVWDDETYQRIFSELRRRGRDYRGMSANQLTGLLRCGVCGANMRIYHSGFWKSPLGNQAYIHCPVGSKDHFSIRYTWAVEMLADELVRCVNDDHVLPDSRTEKISEIQAAVDDLLVRRKRLVDAYEAGLLDLNEYGTRRRAIDLQVGKYEQEKREFATDNISGSERALILERLREKSDTLREYIITENKQDVNHDLRMILDHITAYRDGEKKWLELTFK
jgi:site-specific DNA recombinase